jgi:dethiobiotin synthetase
MNIAVAGIHTGIGKTICSAVICQALGFDYWKPVQAGDLDQSDSIFIQKHINNPACKIHPERYKLLEPMSPHAAAERENIRIRKEDFILPESDHHILLETAGGLMSPLAEDFLNIDLLSHLRLPVVLVSTHYLGSINHTLMSCELLKSRNIQVLGLVFSGAPNPESERVILSYSGLPLLFSIPQFASIDADTIPSFTQTHKIQITHG